MAAQDVTRYLAMLKRLYTSRDLSNQALIRTPFWKTVRKVGGLKGEGRHVPYNYGLPVGGSASFARAKANARGSVTDRWFIQRKRYYHFHTLEAEVIYASMGDEAAFLSARRKELDEVLKQMGQQFGQHLWGNGTGVIGRTSNDPGTGSTATITLTDPRDVHKFQPGMVLIANAAVSGGTNRADAYEVTGLDRSAGTVNLLRVVGSTNDWAANDFIFVDGNHGTAGGAAENPLLLGVNAWITEANPGTGAIPASILGMDRTDDPVFKAGFRGTWEGTIEESSKKLASEMGVYFEGETSALWLSRGNWFRLEQELSSKNRRVISQKATEYFGTPALVLLTPEGEVPVVSDPFCPNDTGYMLDHETWEIHHMEGLPHLVTDDNNGSLRMSDEDGVEVRFRAWLEGFCSRPKTNGRFPIA
jgi:hypothetical protein